MDGRTDVRMDGHLRPTLLGRLKRVDLKITVVFCYKLCSPRSPKSDSDTVTHSFVAHGVCKVWCFVLLLGRLRKVDLIITQNIKLFYPPVACKLRIVIEMVHTILVSLKRVRSRSSFAARGVQKIRRKMHPLHQIPYNSAIPCVNLPKF